MIQKNVKSLLNFCNFPYTDKKDILSNIKCNFLFLISAIAFFCLYCSISDIWLLSPVVSTIVKIVSTVISIVFWVVIMSQCPSVSTFLKETPLSCKFFSVISSSGICWYAAAEFYQKFELSLNTVSIFNNIPFNAYITRITSISAALLSIYFVYTCTLFVLNKLLAEIKEAVKGIKSYEIIIYAILICTTITISVYGFSNSQAFWGTDYSGDIIYTSDSPELVKGNAFINLLHPENDLRQPLFAVFSAPFMGAPYLIGKLLNVSLCVQALLNNAVQMILLCIAIFLISKMLDLSPMKRICFIAISYSTYTFLLFSLMAEQYIIAFFWLSLTVYLISTKGESGYIVFCGTAGTLLTSVVFLPWTFSLQYKELKARIYAMLKSGLVFIALILGFGRFDIFARIIPEIRVYALFTGKGVSIPNKLFQFTTFVKSCFMAPNAGINVTTEEYPSWQLLNPNSINWIGTFIILVAVLSFFINRRKKNTLIAGAWCLFSMVLLFILGWGTTENGLILYSLYFGWAYFVLLFQLIEAVENKLKTKVLVPIFSVCAVAVLLWVNIPGICELLNFAVSYYPV